MKIDLPFYDYKEEFTPIGVLERLMDHPEPSGVCLTTIGGCAVPISGDRLVCNKAINIMVIIPHTTHREFVGFVGFFMTMLASVLRTHTNVATITSNGVSIMYEGKTIGLSSSAVYSDIGVLYVTLFVEQPSVKNDPNYKDKIGVLPTDGVDLSEIDKNLDTMFHNLQRELFQQELAMRVSGMSEGK